MIVLGYVGKHKGDGFRAWLGWAIIRAAQIGRTYRRVTHTEMLLAGDCNAADIASATLMDGGVVRIKQAVTLNPKHWKAIEVPGWEARASSAWFFAHLGEPYDTRGSVGSVLYGIGQAAGSWFCNEADGASVGQIDPHTQPPAGFMAYAMGQPGARDVTAEFFATSEWKEPT